MKRNVKWKKNCPRCGREQTYSCHKALKLNSDNNSLCKKCATKESGTYKDKTFFKTKKYRKKMSSSLRIARKKCNSYNTEEHREKLRIAKLNQIKKLGTQYNYNPNACKYIENFGKKNGYNFCHAMNGGEKIIAGYSLDGYDENKNIVFEYDEPKHNCISVKKNDKLREKRIIKKINPNMFIRYNEQNNKLMDIISGKEL